MTRTITATCPYCHQQHPVEIERNGDEDMAYQCGAELDGGSTCSREVASEDAMCWQHE